MGPSYHIRIAHFDPAQTCNSSSDATLSSAAVKTRTIPSLERRKYIYIIHVILTVLKCD